MKTPRQILFERHRAAETNLNRVRTEVLSASLPVRAQVAAAESGRSIGLWIVYVCHKLWLELVWPARRVWAGFAVAWLAIVWMNLAEFDDLGSAATSAKPPPAGFFMGWEQQEKLTAEFIGQAETQEADQPKPAAPRPRSERQLTWALG